MDFIFTDKNRKNTAMLPDSGYIDCEIGDNSTHSTKISIKDFDKKRFISGGFVYAPGTELGGRLGEMEVSTSDGIITYNGDSFRNLLNKRYTEPPTGFDYMYVSGELNHGIAQICANALHGGLFRVSEHDTGIELGSIRINRYSSVLEACEQFLEHAGFKLGITAKEYMQDDTVHFYMELAAVRINDLSDQIEISEDGQIAFRISKPDENPYTHMLVLGKGRLQNRTVYHLKLNADGSIEQVQRIPDGRDIKVYKYENSNAEEDDELLEEAKDTWKELISTGKTSVSLSDGMGAWIGDVVSGREYITETTIKEKITKVIFKYNDGVESFSYSVGKE